MIESKNDTSKNLEKALQALEQAKQRVANEKKKQNEKKRKAENHHKYIMGGIIVKYFPGYSQRTYCLPCHEVYRHQPSSQAQTKRNHKSGSGSPEIRRSVKT